MNLGMRLLQSLALPLGYSTIFAQERLNFTAPALLVFPSRQKKGGVKNRKLFHSAHNIISLSFGFVKCHRNKYQSQYFCAYHRTQTNRKSLPKRNHFSNSSSYICVALFIETTRKSDIRITASLFPNLFLLICQSISFLFIVFTLHFF